MTAPRPRGPGERVGERVTVYRRGPVWYANFQHRGRQVRQSLGTNNKREALGRAARIDADLGRGVWGAVAAATVAAAAAAYRDFLRAERRAARTLAKYDLVLRRVEGLAAARRAADLTALDQRFMDAYRQQRVAAGAAPKTVYTETVIVRQLVNFAVQRDLVAADPLKGYRVRKPKPAPQPCWTRAEVDRILAASPPAARPALALLAETGLRFGELAWLTWADVDPAANVLRVRAKDGWRPKTGDERAVPLSPAARSVLAGLPRRHRWVVTMPATARRPEPGRPWEERRLLAALKQALRPLGLAGKLHTFRHAFISHALLRGLPPAVVKQWCGHVSDATLRLYTHVHDTASQAAMARLWAADGRTPGSTDPAHQPGDEP